VSGGDLRLRNATLVYADGDEVRGGLVCRDGTIEAVFRRDPADGFDGPELDAGGRPILPGLIDPHVQLYPAADYAHYATETASAALGGVTTIIKMHRDLDGIGSDHVAAMRRASRAVSGTLSSASRASQRSCPCCSRRAPLAVGSSCHAWSP